MNGEQLVAEGAHCRLHLYPRHVEVHPPAPGQSHIVIRRYRELCQISVVARDQYLSFFTGSNVTIYQEDKEFTKHF